MQTTVLIIGAGELGQTLAGLLRTNPLIKLNVWDHNAEKCSDGTDLSSLLPKAGIVLYCAPSWALHQILTENIHYLGTDTLWFNFSKGIDPEFHQFMDSVLQKHMPASTSWAVIGGPLLAEELESGQGGVAVIGTSFLECIRGFEHLFHHIPSIRIAASDDPRGVAVAGTVKNIYALFLGLIDGLGYGANIRSYYMSNCLHEMLQLGILFGSSLPTVLGPAGLGDLLATGSSTFSTNFRTGQERAHGLPANQQGEGIHTLGLVLDLLGDTSASYPILLTLVSIFVSQKDPATAIHDLGNLV